MYGVIGEHDSDAVMIRTFIHRLAYNSRTPVVTFGYGGCGQMLRKGAGKLRDFRSQGCTRFVVCYDTDGDDRAEREAEALDRIVSPANLPAGSCLVLVPTEEIEAWILADADHAIPHLFHTWTAPDTPSPETVPSPKEHLERLSRTAQRRERYAHSAHNVSMAPYLALARLAQRCPSFRPLVSFVQGADRPIPDALVLKAAAGHVRAFAGRQTNTRDAGQLCTAAEWVAFAQFVLGQSGQFPHLVHLVERSWSPTASLRADLTSAPSGSKTPAAVRRVLAMLVQATASHEREPAFGVTDGAHPHCPQCPPPASTPQRSRRGRPRK